MARRTWLRPRKAIGAIGLALAVFGCGSGSFPHRLVAPVSVAPLSDTPTGTLRLLEWCWNRRDAVLYRGLFTSDYRFVFSALDPYGDAYRGIPWTREDEIISATHLFRGGHATEPPASSISFALDRGFLVANDPRPGHDPRWHKAIRTSLVLTIVDPNKETQVTGFCNFFLVRGDSAIVPTEIRPLGFTPDSLHWYIDRWEDDTAGSGTRAQPASRTTLGLIKALYR